DKKRFSNEGEAECNGGIITGNKGGLGACAPYRRRHMCDYNLEFINEQNVLTTHDLLGNVLVTAKYEGDSIVSNHPNKGSSEVCTLLARSFADIGDIIRGKDLFLGNNKENEKLQENLKRIFKNIYANLKDPQALKHYKDDTKNYYQLREDWWALNRNDVWKALTCSAPYDANYVRRKSDRTMDFTSQGYCGHSETNVPTNLDYVPQFLRWFDEWADDFCRKRNIKLKNVKDACRDEKKRKYCSLNGYDCTKTIWKKGVLHRSNECTGCLVKCNPYEIWLGNQREAFRKQKQKYEKEINEKNTSRDSTNNSINNIYYEDFYKKYKEKTYNTVDEFIKLLNEGRYCKTENVEEEAIDFNSDMNTTFYRSKYCQVCPDCGVKCNGETCINKEYDDECRNKQKYEPPIGLTPTKITVFYSGDESDITQKLQKFCKDKNNKNGKNYQKWQCYYKDSIDNKCKMVKNSGNNITEDKITSFDEFFDLWVRNFLIDTIKWENEVKTCINNTTNADCNNE
ncbi:hypothetical protein PFTANZ_06071, partial [Plasmodium falciparum Tanzania (2000708)]